MELGIGLRIDNARRIVLARVSGLVPLNEWIFFVLSLLILIIIYCPSLKVTILQVIRHNLVILLYLLSYTGQTIRGAEAES